MNPDKEVITIVDEKNRETGKVSRAEMRARNLIHRATYILVFNKSGKIFVQKRTITKDIYPDFYEVAAGGVVLAGESYEISARRELKEELGIEVNQLNHHFDYFHDDQENRVWGRVFSCVHEGPFKLQKEEVKSGRFMTIEDTLTMIEEESFCPDGVDILKKYLKANNSSL